MEKIRLRRNESLFSADFYFLYYSCVNQRSKKILNKIDKNNKKNRSIVLNFLNKIPIYRITGGNKW